MFYVYILRRPWNNVPCYVGKGQGDRVMDHFKAGANHPNRHLAAILRKAGGSLPYEIVLETDNEQDAFSKEIELIRNYGRADLKLGSLCNCTNGGEGTSGAVKSLEDRAGISARMSGVPKSLPHRAKLRDRNLGKKHSPETVERRKASLEAVNKSTDFRSKRKRNALALWQTPDFREKNAAGR